MRLNRHKHASRIELNMTPMIDVVFLLLIFFMTVSQVSEARNEPVELPKLRGSRDAELSEIVVNVLRDQTLVLDGTRVTVVDFVRRIDKRIAESRGDASRVAVTIRADARGESRGVNEIVRALTRLGVTRVRIAVQRTE
ncbi:MAG: biopolymer transporter ExbD [Planctomycetes bacterium]|nr:biopolymer transporter ExbD [Planctomycetota bacterium]